MGSPVCYNCLQYHLPTCIIAYMYIICLQALLCTNKNFKNRVIVAYMYYCLQLNCLQALLRTNKNFSNRVTFAYMYYCLQLNCL